MLFFEEYRQQTTVNKREGRERSENQKSQKKSNLNIKRSICREESIQNLKKKAEK